MASDDITENDLLVERFIASFEKLDELTADEDSHQYDCSRRLPIKLSTELSSLESIYSELPARFPRLFERLVLSYRWPEVDLQSYRLLANPPGPGLDRLLREMSKDSIMWKCLLEAGYIQFGKGPDVDYDAICFDRSTGTKNDDCRIVKIDHEQILCYNRVKIVAEVSPSFEQLMLRTIDRANQS